MAERKPLIAPDALPSDTLTRILHRDRKDSGRSPSPNAPSQTVSAFAENNEDAQLASKLASSEERSQVHVAALPDHEASSEAKTPLSRRELRRQAEELADTPVVPITLRIPSGLNDWLDTYAFNHRKEGSKKQSLVAEAVMILMLEKEVQE